MCPQLILHLILYSYLMHLSIANCIQLKVCAGRDISLNYSFSEVPSSGRLPSRSHRVYYFGFTPQKPIETGETETAGKRVEYDKRGTTTHRSFLLGYVFSYFVGYSIKHYLNTTVSLALLSALGLWLSISAVNSPIFATGAGLLITCSAFQIPLRTIKHSPCNFSYKPYNKKLFQNMRLKPVSRIIHLTYNISSHYIHTLHNFCGSGMYYLTSLYKSSLSYIRLTSSGHTVFLSSSAPIKFNHSLAGKNRYLLYLHYTICYAHLSTTIFNYSVLPYCVLRYCVLPYCNIVDWTGSIPAL